jgi:hypothetical protein
VATIANTVGYAGGHQADRSGTPITRAIDRWIYVFMAVLFIAITLAGFVPDSLAKIAAVKAGQRPPFHIVLHLHAVLMASFLLLLLAQTALVAVGKRQLHRTLGIASFALVPAIVVVGFTLAAGNYHWVWTAAQTASADAGQGLRQLLLTLDDILLMQLRIGILFPLFMVIGLRARRGDAGLHKRMMILATAVPLPAAIDRMSWLLPTTLPTSAISTDLYLLLAITPMFAWDLIRHRSVHPAYLIWFAINLPFAVAVHGLWATQWWYSAAPRLMGV